MLNTYPAFQPQAELCYDDKNGIIANVPDVTPLTKMQFTLFGATQKLPPKVGTKQLKT